MNASTEKTGLLPKKGKQAKARILLCVIVVLAVLLLVACAPRAAEEPSVPAEGEGVDGATPVAIEWSPESECEVCHVTEAATAGAILCQAEGQTGSTCVVCHVSDEAAMATVHEGATAADKMPKRLLATKVTDETCLRCHYETREALIQATDGVTQVTDSEGTTLNPHNPGSAEVEHSIVPCANCHQSHEDSSVQDFAQAKCASCHHQDVYKCNVPECHVN